MEIYLISGLCLIIAAIIVYHFVHKQKKTGTRAAELAETAQAIRFSYSTTEPSTTHKILKGIPRLGLASSLAIKNILRGNQHNHTLLIFDTTLGTTAISFILSKTRKSLPSFILRPQTVHTKDILRIPPDFKPVHIQSSPAFNKNYALLAPEPSQIHVLFDQGIIRFFAEHKNWHIDAHQNLILISTPNETGGWLLPAATLEKTLHETLAVIERFA